MENIDAMLEKYKSIEIDRARLENRTDDKIFNGDLNTSSSKNEEENQFKIFDNIMWNEANKPGKIVHNQENGNANNNSPPKTNRRFIISNDMDQYVSDLFYSKFPSFNKVEVEKRSTSRAQQRQELNEYLHQQPNINHIKPVKGRNNSSRTIHTIKYEPSAIPERENYHLNAKGEPEKYDARDNSARYKHLQDLQHTDLTSSSFLNSDTVAERNKRQIEEENRKKMEYQRDLVKQIHEKRMEIERLRQKEKYEEDMLTKRLTDQLKTLELEEVLEKEKVYSENSRLANEQNNMLRMNILSKLDNDHKIYNPYDVRKTQSENGKDKFVERDSEALENVSRSSDGNKIYKFFSNSARNEKIVLPDINNNRTQRCENCKTLVPVEWASFYEHNKLNVCPNCFQVCPFCKQGRDESPSKIKHKNIDNNHLRNKSNRRNHRETDEIHVTEMKRESPVVHYDDDNKDDDDEDAYTVDLSSIYTKSRHKKPFSMNLEKDSIFNPTHRIPESKVAVNIKNGEIYVDKIIEMPLKSNHDIVKLKEKTDEQLGKYYKNYDDVRKRRASYYRNTAEKEQTNAFQVLDDGPIHKASHDIRNNHIQVLTNLGTIRKQLQLEKLEMDNQHK